MQLTKIDFEIAKTLAKAHNHLDFLRRLGNPCFIEAGNDETKQPIVIVTLLHGNEASGLKAIHALLQEDFVFSHPVVFIIGSVSAALTEPVFTHRMLPGHKDLNRCFDSGSKESNEINAQSILADAISTLIKSYEPQCVVDIHNTSGSGPAFAVATKSTDDYIDLASFFGERVIITDIRLGALMEQDFGCPIVTFEAGGTLDSQSDYHAKQGIINLLNSDVSEDRYNNLEVLKFPRRVMLKKNNTLIYSPTSVDDIDLCLRVDIEHFNFANTPANTHIGWISNNVDALLSTDNETFSASDVFFIEDSKLYTKKQLMMFMITTRADIAINDCLFYYVET